ncbi:cytosolic leucyl tRNA synthetase [Glugoides intestinalis]
MCNTGKLEYLNSVECFEQSITEVDTTKEKYFSTFPYPYMNGRLHLGHLYSFSRIDFHSNFKKLQGYNTLVPMGFHCTGMPISASAQKLERELEGKPVDVSIVGILGSLGFKDVTPFKDPLHWIRTFPNLATESLKKFHANIDWRRSFITTDINKYYDSFVKYQFNKLKSRNLLNFGKRYSIFCPIDNQACLDHDRRKGEGIKPIEAVLRKVPIEDGITLLVKCKSVLPIEKIVFSNKKKLVQFIINDRKFVAEEEYFENIVHQVENIVKSHEMLANELKTEKHQIQLIDTEIAGKIVLKNKECLEACPEFEEIAGIKNEELVFIETANFVKVFVPEDLVISRSGSRCVVALLDQWYIDYSIPEWKDKGRICLERMILSTDTREKLSDAMEQIHKWGFSRSFGLGTRIPWDPQYLIDSLSDSTIYNAFYTVKHFLFSDLEGKEEIFPSEALCDEVWKYIFDDVDTIPSKLLPYEDILKKSRESFKYFYPVDIRASGKDLITNHLIFFILNHVALFDEKYWPKRIFTNGHLLLNSAKMSKSDGNFLTVDDALNRFGASATRMCLADCGDTNEDANFLEATANSLVLKLYTLTKTIEQLDDEIENDENVLLGRLNKMALTPEKRRNIFVNEMFLQAMAKNIEAALKSHENMIYRDVLKYGFYETLRVIELYTTLKGTSATLINYGYKTLLSLIYPIVPSLVTYLIKLKFKNDISIPKAYRSGDDNIKAIEHVKTVCCRINSLKKANGNAIIGVNGKYIAWKVECMKIIDECNEKREILSKIEPILQKHSVKKNKGVIFCMDYFDYKEKYLMRFDEMDILTMFSSFIEDSCDIKISIVEDEFAEPLNPTFNFK